MAIKHSSGFNCQYSLSDNQQSVLYTGNSDNASRANNISLDLKITGKFNIDLLITSIRFLIAKHASFRTTFPVVNNKRVQVIHSEIPVAVNIVHLENEPNERKLPLIRQYYSENKKRRFDLGKGPLFYFEMFILDDQNIRLHLFVHPVISDVNSLRFFHDELFAVYNTHLKGEIPDLPVSHATYIDFTLYQEKWQNGNEFNDQLKYWKNELSDAPDLIQIPTDLNRTKNPSFNRNKFCFTIDGKLKGLLTKPGKKIDTDLNVTLLTAFGVLLYRYSSQDDFVVGVPFPNRRIEKFKSIIGAFTNNLPVRFTFREDELFNETSHRIAGKLLTAASNQEVSDKRLIDALKGSGMFDPLSLFNILFSFQPRFSEELNSPDFSLQVLHAEQTSSVFDISLSVHEQKNSLECILEYNTDLFFKETIERLASHYLTILQATSANSNLPVQQIPILPESEYDLVLKTWNETKTQYPEGKCIHNLFEDQVRKTPDAIALVYDNELISYEELNSRANRLARFLSKQGAGEKTSVALCVERSVDLVVGLMAISKSGAAYIPLDPIYPKARLSLILEDAKPIILLTQTSLMDIVPDIGSKIIFIDDRSAYSKEPSGNLTFGNPKTTAYILYTSGSTGKPKGVQIKQHAVVNLISSMGKLLGVTSKDILFAVTTIAFDIAEMEMFLPLFNGAKLVISSQEVATDMELLIEKIQKSGTTLFQATPVTFKMLVIHSWKGKPDLKVVIGGEALSKELVRELLPICKEVWNGYGPTETAIYSVVRKLTPGDVIGDGYVPIGRPIDNTYVYVLNPKRMPVPIGVPGELYIGGVGVSPGYLNLPDMTNERFIPDPFVDDKDARIYKTGDLVQYFPDGNLVFLNRVDSQVKIRGFRIELGEIESALSQNTSIKDNVVIVREDNPGDKRLVAYIIQKEDQETDIAGLRKFLKSRLPDYMVPSAFVVIDKFPLTPNGKVDRKALPVPDEKYAQVSGAYVAPKSDKEKTLSIIWSEILKVEKIGIEDSFFELGGNSLVATMLITRINKEFNIRLPLRIIFEKQTIAEIAAEIEKPGQLENVPEADQIIPHVPVNSNVFPLSHGQKRLWFIENLGPGNRAYNMPFDYQIRGEIDVAIFEQSINELVRRHGSLRTIIPYSDDSPVQKVLDSFTFSLKVENLDNLPEKEKVREAEKFSHENEMHVFDLGNGPLFICTLLKLSRYEWTFLTNMHHIITDGWSVKILLEELGIIYTAIIEHKPLVLPSLPVTYPDFAIWQNEWLKGPDCQKQLDFYTKELKGVPDLLQLPMDFQRPKNQTYDGDEVSFIIDQNLTEQLHFFSQKNNVSLFITLLSIFNSLIARYTLQEEFVIGIPIAGRIHKELESLVGILINNFPLRIAPRENMSFPEMFEMTKKKFFYAYDNQEVPFDRIVEELRVNRYPNISPLFQVMFNLLNMFEGEIYLSDSKMEMLDKRRNIAQFDLSLHIYETKNILNCVLEYNTNLFSRSRIERMGGHFLELVKSLMKDPGQKIRRIPIITEQETKRFLQEWNSTVTIYPKDKCIHELFEEQVRKSPAAVAVIDDQKPVTYSELNEKSNRLARFLHKSGASQGALIGICIDRSSDLLVALLAVLKAGCTYIPLDPIYPKNRISLILDDGNPVILLTEKNLLDNLPQTSSTKVFIEESEKYQNESGENPDYPVLPDTVAYLIYTSGSTGKPKGVRIEHRSVVNFMGSMKKKPGISSEDVMLALTTISFDIAGLELYLPVLNGAKVIITSQETSMNADLLIEKIGACQPSILQATPVTFRMLISAGWKGLKKLKVLCGGEALPKDLAFELNRRCGELWNMYGPTETTIWSTMEKVETNEDDNTGYVNLGYPIDNTFIYVLNSEFQAVPVGYPGELFIGGDGLARDYYNLPEFTKEKFLPDPFSGKAGARMYRTGDLVQRTEDGKLEFLNRIDSQVKIRGFRIELGEIESALSQNTSIKDNVVIVREDNPGDKRLVAYIIQKDGQETNIAGLRKFLKSRLPDYMIPAAIVVIEKFPLTPNGKVDRKALPSPVITAMVEDHGNVAPQNEMEKKLFRIWAEVLNLKSIGIYDNFFDIGGHSMIAVTLMVKIEKELGIRLPLAILFEQANIHDMAEFLEDNVKPVHWGSLVPIKPQGKKRPLYLIHGAGLNLLLYTAIVSHLDPDQPVYGLQAKGLDGKDEPIDTIHGIADYYISEILSVDNSGTYALAGFSMGGQIAYEMARQLVERGKKVSFLGVFDTVSYNVGDKHLPIVKRYAYRIGRLYHKIFWILETFIRKPSDEKLKFVLQKLRSLKQIITKDDYKIKPEGVSEGKRSELPKYLHNVHKANNRAMVNYILPVYSGKLHLFRAKNQTFYIKDPVRYGWDKYAKGGVVVLDIPGEHSRIFAPPNDKIFAEVLQQCLNENE